MIRQDGDARARRHQAARRLHRAGADRHRRAHAGTAPGIFGGLGNLVEHQQNEGLVGKVADPDAARLGQSVADGSQRR